MTQLTSLKNRITLFVGEYENFLISMGRFLLAALVFVLIKQQIGYSTLAGRLPVILGLALVCAFLPMQAILWFGTALIALNLYKLSMACALVFLLVAMLIYLMYFRFVPKDSLGVILTPVAFALRIPYVMPVGISLLRGPYSILSVICGTVVYYLLAGIRTHASEISEMEADPLMGLTSKINLALGQIVGNKDMYLVIAIFVITAILVYTIRRSSVNYAWTLAIIVGILLQMLGLFVGYMILQVSGKTLWLMLGSIISLGISFLIEFIFMSLDYSRVERVQFEDDDFYYYVKAVPKNASPMGERKEIHFGSRPAPAAEEEEDFEDETDEEMSEEPKEIDFNFPGRR